MRTIRTLIIDDERLAREEMQRALTAFPDISVLAMAEAADDAIALIQEHRPDVLFLDVQMPEKNGFDLLAELDYSPVVVFVTAFDQYAVQAFETSALDYLVKPVREERLVKAIERIRNKIEEQATNPAWQQQFFIKDGHRCFFVKQQDIYLIESLGNYARLCFGDTKSLLKRSLTQLEKQLDPALFFRINREHIVNITYITAVSQLPKGNISIQLAKAGPFVLSDRRSVQFRQLNKF